MKYKCSICGYIYDESKEKVKFDELPSSWTCPLCGAPKSAFEPIEEAPPVVAEVKPDILEKYSGGEDLKQLSAGQLSALFSNLARGAEKQYKPEASAMFKEIADYFSLVTPSIDGASIEDLDALLIGDIHAIYPDVTEVAKQNNDRGTQRISVWGEKVSKMMENLIERYQDEGEKMLEGLEVWVCSVCGFIYIGKNAPELCPVCKVPSWKFDKIEGRNI